MGVFSYKAMAVGGTELVRGTIGADSPRQARESLRAQGLRVRDLVEVSPKRGTAAHASAGASRARLFRRSRPERKVVDVCHELATLLSAGIPLLQSLDAIARQHRGHFQQSLLLLRDRIAGGAGLAEAMRAQPEIFDALSISMVEVGEKSGTLDDVLEQLATFKGRANQLKGRIGTALIYPAIVVTAGSAVTIFLMTFVVPQLLQSLLEAGRPLPLMTRIVKAVSDAMLGYWWLMLGGLIAAAVAGWFAMRLPRVRRRWHSLQLKLPLVGELIRKQAIIRIAVALATLTRSGVEFVAAVRIVRQSMDQLVIHDALKRCEDAVRAGRDIAPALEATGVFPATVVQVVDVGQASGKLDQMLERLAAGYDAQVQSASQRLVAVLEPMLILLLATFVGFVVLAVILPYMEAGNVL